MDESTATQHEMDWDLVEGPDRSLNIIAITVRPSTQVRSVTHLTWTLTRRFHFPPLVRPLLFRSLYSSSPNWTAELKPCSTQSSSPSTQVKPLSSHLLRKLLLMKLTSPSYSSGRVLWSQCLSHASRCWGVVAHTVDASVVHS